MFKAFSIFGRDFSGMNIRRKAFDAFVRLFDIGAQLLVRCQCRIAQPIMTDHSLFIRIGDRSRLELPHRGKRLVDLGLHFLEKIVRKLHPANVDGKIELVVAEKISLETLPERGGSHD